MRRQLLLALVLPGLLLLLASQLVFAFSLDDEAGFALTRVSLLSTHGPAILILVVLALLALVGFRLGPARRPAVAARVAPTLGILMVAVGLAALVVFLLIDLSDLGDTGMFSHPNTGILDTTAVSTAGFWLEPVGAVLVILGGLGLAFRLGDRNS